MKYTEDFSSFLIPYWKKYFSIFKDKANINYLEVGVFEGRTSFWVIDNILTANSATATLIDKFDLNCQKNFYSNFNQCTDKDKIILHEGDSKHILPILEKNNYDIIYLDGEHNSQALTLDLSYSWPLLKNDGYLIFDDYKLHENIFPDHCRPQAAIDHFLFAFQNEIEIIHKCHMWVIVQKKINNFDTEYDMINDFTFDYFNKKLFHLNGKEINLNDQEKLSIAQIFVLKNKLKNPELEIKKALNL